MHMHIWAREVFPTDWKVRPAHKGATLHSCVCLQRFGFPRTHPGRTSEGWKRLAWRLISTQGDTRAALQTFTRKAWGGRRDAGWDSKVTPEQTSSLGQPWHFQFVGFDSGFGGFPTLMVGELDGKQTKKRKHERKSYSFKKSAAIWESRKCELKKKKRLSAYLHRGNH